MWCCTKPYFSFHFSTWATLSTTQRGKSAPECWYIHKKHPSTNAAFNTPKSERQKCFWVACLENQEYFPGHHSSSPATFTQEFCCNIYSTRAALRPIRLLSTAAAKSSCYSQAVLVLPPLPPITAGEEDLLSLLERFVSPLPFCNTANGNPRWLLLITHVHWESNSSYC